jgi:hypothetical protein
MDDERVVPELIGSYSLGGYALWPLYGVLVGAGLVGLVGVSTAVVAWLWYVWR